MIEPLPDAGSRRDCVRVVDAVIDGSVPGDTWRIARDPQQAWPTPNCKTAVGCLFTRKAL